MPKLQTANPKSYALNPKLIQFQNQENLIALEGQQRQFLAVYVSSVTPFYPMTILRTPISTHPPTNVRLCVRQSGDHPPPQATLSPETLNPKIFKLKALGFQLLVGIAGRRVSTPNLDHQPKASLLRHLVLTSSKPVTLDPQLNPKSQVLDPNPELCASPKP